MHWSVKCGPRYLGQAYPGPKIYFTCPFPIYFPTYLTYAIPEIRFEFVNHTYDELLQCADQKSIRSTRQGLRLRFGLGMAASLIVVVFFLTPQGQALAQEMLQFFTRAENNELPVQSFPLTPLPVSGTRTPNPASIIDANLEITEVELQAGYDVFEPSWIPSNLTFAGASIEDPIIVRIFYRYMDTNGLVFRQEPVPGAKDCELCNMVGPEASVAEVAIGNTTGEYVEGVWKLTEQGPVWESDPYLKTMRWQMNGMAFELLYMGPPDTLSMEDMIAIAESIK